MSPVGYAKETSTLEEKVMSRFGQAHRRKPLVNLVTGITEDLWPPWIKTALEAARLAPSAVNRQPWTFRVESDSITVATKRASGEFGVSRRLDCGIAMLHIEVAALRQGIRGKWVFLDSPQVARFGF